MIFQSLTSQGEDRKKHLPHLFSVHIQHPIILERQMGFRVSWEMESTISQHLTPSTMHTDDNSAWWQR